MVTKYSIEGERGKVPLRIGQSMPVQLPNYVRNPTLLPVQTAPCIVAGATKRSYLQLCQQSATLGAIGAGTTCME